MTEQPNRRPRRSLLMVGIVVAGLISLVAFGAMIVIALEKLATGGALDTYRTHWMVEDNWVGFLVFVTVAAVASLVGLLFRLKELRELRDLETKYVERGRG